MRIHQYAHKKRASQSSHTLVPRSSEVQASAQPPVIQAKSNEEGLAEHAERLKKFERLGNPFLDKGPPRFDNDMTSPLQPKPWIQRKLTLGQPGDKYEQEADRVASQVVQQINAPAFSQSNQGQSVQRKKAQYGEMQANCIRDAIQRRQGIAGGEASVDLESSINSARGRGQPLDAGLQQSMGQAMGADFSGVKVHTDTQSDQLNQSIQARAFTTGQDVFFREGAYQPVNRGGQELMAHELTHVMQQNGNSEISTQIPEAVNLQGAITALAEPMITIQRMIGNGGIINQSRTVVGPNHTLFKVNGSFTFRGVLQYDLKNLESGSTQFTAWNDDNYRICKYDVDLLGEDEVRKKLGWIDVEDGDEVREFGVGMEMDEDMVEGEHHDESVEIEVKEIEAGSDMEEGEEELHTAADIIRLMLNQAPVWQEEGSRPSNVVMGEVGGSQDSTCEDWVQSGLNVLKSNNISCEAIQLGWGKKGFGHTALYILLQDETHLVYDGWAQVCCEFEDYENRFRSKMSEWTQTGLKVCSMKDGVVCKYNDPVVWIVDLLKTEQRQDLLWNNPS